MKKLTRLTKEQKKAIPAHVKSWREIGLCTKPADRRGFEHGAEGCYKAAKMPWPGNTVWVSSPLILSIAAPCAEYIIKTFKKITLPRIPLHLKIQSDCRGKVWSLIDRVVAREVIDTVYQGHNNATSEVNDIDERIRWAIVEEVGYTIRASSSFRPQAKIQEEVFYAVCRSIAPVILDFIREVPREIFVQNAVDCNTNISSAALTKVGSAISRVMSNISKVVSNEVGSIGQALDQEVYRAIDHVNNETAEAVVREFFVNTPHSTGIKKYILNNWNKHFGGQFWAGGWWLGGAYTSFFRDVCGLELNKDLWERSIAYEETMKSAGWWYPNEHFVMVCERPTEIHLEEISPTVFSGRSHRLHCVNGPAIRWPDGWGIYTIHGVQVPSYIVETPELITAEKILSTKNSEVRRIMIERYGYEKYIKDANLKIVDTCPPDHKIVGLRTARLYTDGIVVLLDMLNSSPEPDGSHRRYIIQVDPDCYGGRASRECVAAMASTWRRSSDHNLLVFKSPEEYLPVAES